MLARACRSACRPWRTRSARAVPYWRRRRAGARRKAQGRTASVISPLAVEAVRRIDALFAIERTMGGQSAERRRQVRQEASAPLIADLEHWLRVERPKLSRGNDLAKAMDYLLK